MGKIIFHKAILLFYLILAAGCGGKNFFLYIQTYPRDILENEVGSFDVNFRRYGFDRFWGTINCDLKENIILYKDSVKVWHKGHIKDVVFIDGTYRKDNPLKFSCKNDLRVHFYFYTQKGDTVMMYTKNALFTSSGVFPLDSIRFIHGERFKFKDNFVGKKGGVKYGHYNFSL